MKHTPKHARHTLARKRTILELLGLSALLYLSFQQHETLSEAVKTLKNSQISFVVLACLLYWFLLPLTSYSYRLLTKRHVPIVTTYLAQLAASGPGRVIPGGLGHLGFGALNLRKMGFPLQEALAVTIANNIIGFLTNLLIVMSAFILRPSTSNASLDFFSTTTLIFIFICTIFVVCLLLLLSRRRKTNKNIKKFTKQWSMLRSELAQRPLHIFLLILIAGAIALGHATILLLSGNALHISIGLSDALIALGIGVAAGGALPTPGGLGAVEAGTIGSLVALGYDPVSATSVTLIFRTATYWQPLLPGLISYLYLRKRSLL